MSGIDVPEGTETLTDAEFAVTLDSLRHMRDHLEGKGHAAPNVRSALAKLQKGIGPATNGITFKLNNPA